MYDINKGTQFVENDNINKITIEHYINKSIPQKNKYILIGDSYADRPNSWCDYFIEKMNLTEDDYYKSVKGGFGFHPSYDSYFITLLENLYNTISNKKAITHIIVQGGFNDRNTDDDILLQSIQNFSEYCKVNYPNAIIYIGAFGWSMNSEFISELKYGKYINVYSHCGIFDNCKFIQGSNFIMHDFKFFEKENQDEYHLYLGYRYVHPNSTGSSLIADCIISNINGSTYNFFDNSILTDYILSDNDTVRSYEYHLLNEDGHWKFDDFVCYN